MLRLLLFPVVCVIGNADVPHNRRQWPIVDNTRYICKIYKLGAINGWWLDPDPTSLTFTLMRVVLFCYEWQKIDNNNNNNNNCFNYYYYYYYWISSVDFSHLHLVIVLISSVSCFILKVLSPLMYHVTYLHAFHLGLVIGPTLMCCICVFSIISTDCLHWLSA